MILRQISIRGFRGINELEWNLPENLFYCLVGPGDSTKSTVLDAIEWVLTPRWNIPIYDTDFYQCNVDSPIDIKISIGALPDTFLSLDKFGPYTRGWKDNLIYDEPVEGSEEIITVRLFIDRSLEPCWTLFTERYDKPRSISSRERESLGMVRLSPYIDRHLCWGYGSALTRLTDNLDNVPRVLADAGRSARGSFDNSRIPRLKEVADQAHSLAINFGVSPKNEFIPGLDPVSASESIGSIALFDGQVPTRQSGLGSRRLLALALQQNCVKDGSIQLIDEIEQGLEPHRIRHLLHVLDSRETDTQENNKNQIFITTHSRDVIEELTTTDIFVVRSTNGITTICNVNNELQNTIRAESNALLARKIIICEGKTELGICRELDRRWAKEEGGKPFAHLGVVPVDGNGSSATKHAQHLWALGYDVCYFADGDRDDLTPSIETLEASGIRIIRWSDKYCTEQRFCHDLNWDKLQLLVNLAFEIKGEDLVLSAMATKFKCEFNMLSTSIDDWLNLGLSEATIRDLLAQASAKTSKEDKKSGNWFKIIDAGEKLGDLIYNCWEELKGTDTELKIGQLKEWAYD